MIIKCLYFYTYIVKCKDHTYYIGQTNDLEKRIKEHNGLIRGGAKYTKYKSPVELVYTEEFVSRSLAMKREAVLKKLTRKQKEELIFKTSFA